MSSINFSRMPGINRNRNREKSQSRVCIAACLLGFVMSVMGPHQVSATPAVSPAASSPSTPSNIAIGSRVRGKLSQAEPVQLWQFSAAHNQIMQVRGRGKYGMILEIYAPNGIRIDNGNLSNYPSGWQFQAIAGIYQIRVSTWNNAKGRYHLGVESQSPSSPDARRIFAGFIKNGRLANRIEVDQFKFTAAGNQIFQVRSSLQHQMQFEVYDPYGTKVSVSADGLGQFRAMIPGQYTIQVSTWGYGDTGNYSIGLESIAPASFDATPIVRGQTGTSMLTSLIAVDQWKFNASANHEFQVLLDAGDNTIGLRVDVFTPSGERINPRPDGSGIYRATLSGQYVIQVSHSHFGPYFGIYDVTLD